MNNLENLKKAIREREPYWLKGDKKPDLLFRATELGGEAGELLNAVKKLVRHDLGMVGGSSDKTNLAEELGDVLISAVLLADEAGLDLWDCAVMKFNKTSNKHGFPITLNRKGEKCEHRWEYYPDPSGNNDSFYECTLCNMQRNR